MTTYFQHKVIYIIYISLIPKYYVLFPLIVWSFWNILKFENSTSCFIGTVPILYKAVYTLTLQPCLQRQALLAMKTSKTNMNGAHDKSETFSDLLYKQRCPFLDCILFVLYAL